MQFLGAKFRIQLGPTVRNVIAHEVKIFYMSLRFAKLYINTNLAILLIFGCNFSKELYGRFEKF